MNEDYVMHAGDKFIARECGCSMTVITGPSDTIKVIQLPQCCCGHDLVKDNNFIGGVDVIDIPELQRTPILTGMVE